MADGKIIEDVIRLPSLRNIIFVTTIKYNGRTDSTTNGSTTPPARR